jgi:hypothetical protein
MTSLVDGIEIDLDHVQVALDGSHWLWTCELTQSGQPLMLRVDGRSQDVQQLDYVARWHGNLAAERQPTTAAMYRRVLEAS